MQMTPSCREKGATASLGYRAIGQDYGTGRGLSRFEWDVIYHGPIMALANRF